MIQFTVWIMNHLIHFYKFLSLINKTCSKMNFCLFSLEQFSIRKIDDNSYWMCFVDHNYKTNKTVTNGVEKTCDKKSS